MDDALLSVRDLRTHFHTRDGVVRAVDGVSFDLHAGETLCVVGESGCGKSVTALSILGLVPMPPARIDCGGQVLFCRARIWCSSSEERLREIRGNSISMIFQEPMTSLNPVITVGNQIAEALRLHQAMNEARRRATVRSRC